VPIRSQQDRVRLVQRTSVRREPIYPTDRARGRFPGKIQTAGQRAQRASVVQYRMATWCVKDCAPTSHYSSRCTAITVMLSSPPREFASWMSISGTWSSAVCTSASRISSLSIRFDSPSEQSRNLSPDRVSTPTTSTRTSSSNPTDRVMMFLRRLCFASSSVSRPARTCSLTGERRLGQQRLRGEWIVDSQFGGDQLLLDGLDRQAAGGLAARVPAHPVADHVQADVLVDEEAVLVVIALHADIGARGAAELRHGEQLTLPSACGNRLTGPRRAARGRARGRRPSLFRRGGGPARAPAHRRPPDRHGWGCALSPLLS